MAESIQNRRAQQTQLRATQQEQAKRKRELAAQQKEDLQSMKQYYADKSREIDGESAAAVSHIRSSSREPAGVDGNPRLEKKSIYNRKAQTEPAVQNYETKETDKFYQVLDRGSRVSDNGNNYVIEAYAPEHEQNNLRVSIQKNKAVISGQRKHADEVDDGTKKMRTNNFQTFREEFKFDRPVSHEGMTRERVGDFVRFSIPKLEAIATPDDESTI
ncbi:MAG: hypothetical protein A2622_10150 [Bdellovibrionales bacterium RIFCSPHIGHO2_01_FULL_40_29]|nr:MAG: hypothetical protein A2622_10150 [Bdellovibrionales bacterium RIFCSPHIGHO2_01_FULL_40_29]OFZ32392.1 MAG: hypothetical protein A3D17_12510 [Bdellovibrionales bacterium RIFCSPHIGHO2_02_FULL_40_15]